MTQRQNATEEKQRKQREKARKLFMEDGLTIAKIAQMFGVSRRTVERWSANDPKGKWSDTRQTQEIVMPETKIQLIADQEVAKRVAQRVQETIDVAEIISQNLLLARAMKSKAAKRLKDLDPSELAPKDVALLVKEAILIENNAMGLASQRIAVDVNFDFAKLSDEQLERIAAGEDIKKVAA